MPSIAVRLTPLALALLLGACASRSLPKYETPLARARIQQVRTTAYTHTEADHVKYGRRNALGMRLMSSGVRSAAADWSRWPAGTVFRILETGETYQVDDYGWALSGTNTIDLYKPSRAAMNAWGVRRVTIQNIVWGDVDRSLAILRGRSKYKHVRRMIAEMEDRYRELKKPVDGAQFVQAEPAALRAMPVARRAEPVRPAEPVRLAAKNQPALAPFRATR
jgi:3D (Asp-Asp-Asp) domain-containing protein